MQQIIINGKTYSAEAGTPLKLVLREAGFNFPCGGNGRCGKCKICCNEIKGTALDGKFLNEKQLVSGIRLACDKVVESDLNITYEQDEKVRPQNAVKLSDCRLSVNIGDETIEVSILNDAIVETVTLPNPLKAYGEISEVKSAYASDPAVCTKALRAAIGKTGVELFEEYSAAKADTLSVAANDIYVKILLGLPLNKEIPDYNEIIGEDNLSLPTESVYVLPTVGEYVSGEFLCLTVGLPEKSLLIDCEETVTIASIGPDDSVMTAMWNIGYSPLELQSIKAAALTLTQDLDYKPALYVSGKYLNKLSEVLDKEEKDYIVKEKDPSLSAQACLYNRFRAKLVKEKKRASYLDLLKSERFQENLIEVSKTEL